MGRPTKKTQEVVERILTLISSGKTLCSICEPDDMPDRDQVYRWMQDDADFRGMIKDAREKGYDAIADECVKIADFAALDTLISEKTGNPMIDSEWVQRSKLRIDTRLRLLAKWSPKRYGDKMEVTGTGLAPVLKITIGGDVN